MCRWTLTIKNVGFIELIVEVGIQYLGTRNRAVSDVAVRGK